MLQPDHVQWAVTDKVPRAFVGQTVAQLLALLGEAVRPGDHVVIMSNGGFGGIHQQLLTQLSALQLSN